MELSWAIELFCPLCSKVTRILGKLMEHDKLETGHLKRDGNEVCLFFVCVLGKKRSGTRSDNIVI